MLQFSNQVYLKMNKHRQQVFWQIFLPIFLIIGMVFSLIYFIFGKNLISGFDLRIWSDISLIFILLPFMFSSVISLGFVILGIFLISKNQSAICAVFSKFNDIATKFSIITSKFTNSISQPIIQVESIIDHFLPQKKENNKNE